MMCELDWLPLLAEVVFWAPPPAVFGAAVWIVVRVVVKDLTEGAGDEKVLSPPRRPFTV